MFPPAEAPIRTLFISDLHLGFRFSNLQQLLGLLSSYRPEILYVVGDFLDGWSLKRGGYWQPECNMIVSRIFQLAQQGTRLRFVVGNHDRFLHDPLLQQMIISSGAELVSAEFVHETADGRQLLVTHGDAFDRYERVPSPLVWLFSRCYEAMLTANIWWSQKTGSNSHGSGSLIARLRSMLPTMGLHIERFRARTVRYARARGTDGVVCGHIHVPAMEDHHGLAYCNPGDWIENCSALIEEFNGNLRIVQSLTSLPEGAAC